LRLSASPSLASAEGIDWDSVAGTRSIRGEELPRGEGGRLAAKPSQLAQVPEVSAGFCEQQAAKKEKWGGRQERGKNPNAALSAGDLERSESFKPFSLCRIVYLGVRAGRIVAGASEMSVEQ